LVAAARRSAAEIMTRTLYLAAAVLLTLSACKSAAEKERLRDSAMIEAAKADAADEADFVTDSVALAASITMDTVRSVRSLVRNETDDDGNVDAVTVYQALAGNGHACELTTEKYHATVVGDTLSCQWAAAP
jgi:hypothetical protein